MQQPVGEDPERCGRRAARLGRREQRPAARHRQRQQRSAEQQRADDAEPGQHLELERVRVARLLRALALLQVEALEVLGAEAADGLVLEAVPGDRPEVVAVRAGAPEARLALARSLVGVALLELGPGVAQLVHRVVHGGERHQPRSRAPARRARSRCRAPGVASCPRRARRAVRRRPRARRRRPRPRSRASAPRSRPRAGRRGGPGSTCRARRGASGWIGSSASATRIDPSAMRSRSGEITSRTSSASGRANTQPRLWPSSASPASRVAPASALPRRAGWARAVAAVATQPNSPSGPHRDVRVDVARRLGEAHVDEEVAGRRGGVRAQQLDHADHGDPEREDRDQQAHPARVPAARAGTARSPRGSRSCARRPPRRRPRRPPR